MNVVSKKYSNLICATINIKSPTLVKSIYITKYFKKYLNNKIPLTFEMLMLNYHGNTMLNYYGNTITERDKIYDFNVNLQIINGKNIDTIYLNETI